MGTGKQRTSSGAKVRVALVIDLVAAEPVLALVPVEVVLQEAALGIARVVLQEPGTVPVEVLELEIVPVAEQGLGIGPAVAELEIVPAAPELEHDLVAVAPVEGHQPAQLAVVALRIKSVTAAHRPGLVPLLEAEEDLVAAVAETTREPAAAEAVIAWEVAE